MSFKLSVEKLATRRQIIADRCAAVGREEVVLNDIYPDREAKQPLIMVPIGLPIYRMANGRTQAEQRLIISEEGLDEGYFSEGQENVEAQTKQHAILVDAAKDGVADRVTPIIEVLEKNPQKEPLLVSPEGVVLNGNRRLAAMRELFATDPDTFKRFSLVKVAVLPPMGPREEIEIEVRLQMAPQTKLEYSWVNQGIVIQNLLREGKSTKDIGQIMGWQEKKVKRHLNALQEGELYLTKWHGNSRHVGEIADKKQLFFDQGEILSTQSGPLREATRKLTWTLASSGEDFEGRFYDLNYLFRDKTLELVKSVNEVHPLGVGDNKEGNDDFDFESDHDSVLLQAFAEKVNNSSEGSTLRSIVVEKALELDEKRKIEESQTNPLTHVKKALQYLSIIDINHAAVSTLAQISGQLARAAERITELQELLRRRTEK